MKIEEFTLERIQSLYENVVPLNLSDSGVHPMSIRDLLSDTEINELLDLELGYGWTNGEVSLRNTVAGLYKDRTEDDVIVTNGSAEANFLMVMSLLDPGDEIVVFTPNYLQIFGWANAIGVDVKSVTHDESADWRFVERRRHAGAGRHCSRARRLPACGRGLQRFGTRD